MTKNSGIYRCFFGIVRRMIVQFYNFIQQHIAATVFMDCMALLLVLPLLFACIEALYIRKRRGIQRQVVYFKMHSNCVLLAYIGVQSFVLTTDKLPITLALVAVAKLLYIYIAFLLEKLATKMQSPALPKRAKKERVKIKDSKVIQTIETKEESIQEEHDTVMEKDVHIVHIDQTLESLKRQKLSAGDRLECKKIEEIIRLYRVKSTLSHVEVSVLNDILATLLKMMAKYTV